MHQQEDHPQNRLDPQIAEQEQVRQAYRNRQKRKTVGVEHGQVAEKSQHSPDETDNERPEQDKEDPANNSTEEDITKQENEDLEIEDANNRP
jgi:hypothetical protein